MTVETQRIFDFMPRVEGKLTCKGYIPCYRLPRYEKVNFYGVGDPKDYETMGYSGVTIGVGVDLGQQTEKELSAWGVSDRVLDIIRPFIGLRKYDAIEALHLQPLRMDEADVVELTNAEHKGYLNNVVIPWWNKQNGIKFEDMPPQAQVVAFSRCYHFGCAGFQHFGPNTLKAMLAGDWDKAVRCLCDKKGWPAEYADRIYTEGLLLKEIA